MRFSKLVKFIAAVLLFSVVFGAECFADVTVTDTPELNTLKVGPADGRFPFAIATNAEDIDKLCYAGHMVGGGIFYDDGKMILPTSQFGIVAQGNGEDKFGELSAEITLLYENSQNSGCTKEIVRKFPKGSLTSGALYGFLSESSIKTLTQRKKLYSSDLSSIRVTLTYRDRTKTTLFYVAKDAEYTEAVKKK